MNEESSLLSAKSTAFASVWFTLSQLTKGRVAVDSLCCIFTFVYLGVLNSIASTAPCETCL